MSSVEVADLFLRVYDKLRSVPIDDLTAELASARLAAVEVDGVAVSSGLYPDPGTPEDAQLLAVLLGLHQALLAADPERDIPNKQGMAAHAARWDLYRRLNTDPADGILIFSRAIAGRPDVRNAPNRLADLFPGLLRVDAADLAHTELIATTAATDLRVRSQKPSDPYELHGAAPVIIGQIPMLACPEDVIWQRVSSPDGLPQDGYTVAPVSANLIGRIDPALAALATAEVHLGLIPESALDDTVLQGWQRVLGDHSQPTGSLQWLLAGTGPVTTVGVDVQPGTTKLPNRAVVLTSDGDVVFTQDKRAGFTMSPEQIRRYRLEPVLGANDTLAEHIRKGSLLTIIDASAGRFAIAICEDHGRLIEIGGLCAKMGVTHLLVPVIAPAMWSGGWQCTGARQLASELGVSTAVGNSLAVDQRGRADADGVSPPAITLFAVQAPHRAPVRGYADVHEISKAGPEPVTTPAIDCVTVRVATI